LSGSLNSRNEAKFSSSSMNTAAAPWVGVMVGWSITQPPVLYTATGRTKPSMATWSWNGLWVWPYTKLSSRLAPSLPASSICRRTGPPRYQRRSATPSLDITRK